MNENKIQNNKECIVCKKKYIPIYYAVDIQHGSPHGQYIEISYLSCGKCPDCARKCYHDGKWECVLEESEDCGWEVDDEDEMDLECYGFFGSTLTFDGYGEIGHYINFYNIKNSG